MTTIDQARATLRTMRAALNKRRVTTTDPVERQALDDEVGRINEDLRELTSRDTRAAVDRLDAATARVQVLLSSARPSPISAGPRRAPGPAVHAARQPAQHAGEHLMAGAFIAREANEGEIVLDVTPVTIQAGAAAPAAEPRPAPAAPTMPRPLVAQASTVAPDGLPPFVRGSTFAALEADYALCWAACQITPARLAEVERSADRLIGGQARYQAVSARTGRVPWQLIGIMHGLECGYDFARHLHNGDDLDAPTRRVPAGRPLGWDPSRRTWEDSAVDAVELKNMHRVGTWSLPAVLYALEGFNGFGYRSRKVRSPYLWSFSNLYSKGKFIRDGVFDADAVSAQVGSALVLKVLEERGAGIGAQEHPPAISQLSTGTADLVRQVCEACFEAHRNDCNRFVKAVATKLGISINGRANDIVDALRNDSVWTPLPDGVAAARSAAAGNLVIGGLKGTEQANPSEHGHVVVVVEGRVERGAYPTAYWGSLGGHFAKDKTINFAWRAPDRDRVIYAERPIP